MPALRHPGSSPGLADAYLDKGRPTSGVSLANQMARDDVDVSAIVVKCCEAIEKYGLDQQGIYRIGGTHSKVMKLKERLDRGASSVHSLSAYDRGFGRGRGHRAVPGSEDLQRVSQLLQPITELPALFSCR